jgi:Flp pilus assembly CpaE family ATPase
MITLGECREALGDGNLEVIRNDFKSAVRSINFGKPLAETAPISGLRRDLRNLAEKLLLKGAPAPAEV